MLMPFAAAGGTTRSPTGRCETAQRAQVLLPDRLFQLKLDLAQRSRFIIIKLLIDCCTSGRLIVLPSRIVRAGRDRHGQGKAVIGVMVHHSSFYERGELLGLLVISCGGHWGSSHLYRSAVTSW